MTSFLDLKDINATIYFSKDFIYMLFYFSGISNNGKPVLMEIKKRVYLIKKLKTKILVSNNILVLKSFVLDLLSKKVIIFSCNTIIQILIKS